MVPMASDQDAVRPSPHQPASSAWPVSAIARCIGWLGTAFSMLAHSSSVGSAVDAEDRRALVTGRCEHQAGLEQRHVGVAATDVAGQGLQQARQQRRGEQRLLVVERVDHAQCGTAVVVGRQVEPVPVGLADERDS